jgi:hypothetical protein
MNITDLSARQLRRAAHIKDQIQKLKTELSRMLGTGGADKKAAPRRRRKMSAAVRAKMAAAARARWAKIKAAKK